VVALDSEGRQNFRDLLAGRGNLHYDIRRPLSTPSGSPRSAAQSQEASLNRAYSGDHDGAVSSVLHRGPRARSLRRRRAARP
jgi:hypothetical protein